MELKYQLIIKSQVKTHIHNQPTHKPFTKTCRQPVSRHYKHSHIHTSKHKVYASALHARQPNSYAPKEKLPANNKNQFTPKASSLVPIICITACSASRMTFNKLSASSGDKTLVKIHLSSTELIFPTNPPSAE